MSKYSKLDYELCNPIIIGATQFYPKPTKLVKAEFTCNGEAALVGLDLATDAQIWNATVNLLDCPPNDGCVWINNNGHNEGLMDELIKKQVIEFNNRFTRVKDGGYVFECRLLI